MRFLHTADWHLGKLFGQRYMTEDQRYVLEELVALAVDEDVQAVVIAGDVYDRAVPPAEAVALFDEVLARLVGKGIAVLYIAGNHDSAARLDFGRELLAASGVYLRGCVRGEDAPVVLEDAAGPVYFSLLPFATPVEVRAAFQVPREEPLDFDAAMARQVQAARAQIPDDCRSVAVAHAFLAGGRSASSERPLSVGGTDQVRPAHFLPYSYTALGHLHGPQRAGAEKIRYAGSLLKYSFDEAAQKKGALVVELAADGAIETRFEALAPRHDVRIVRGTLEELRQADFDPLPHDDYVRVDLLDRATILNAYDKLTAIYPNLFALTRPNWQAAQAEELRLRPQAGEVSELALFRDFYEEMTRETFSPDQQKYLEAVLEEMAREEREEV